MSDIIHDSTRGWLLLTEKWPDISNFELFFKDSEHYYLWKTSKNSHY